MAYDGIVSGKRVTLTGQQLRGFRGVTWTLSRSDPKLPIGLNVEIQLPGGRKRSWRMRHTFDGHEESIFMPAPSDIQQLVDGEARSSPESEIQITATFYTGTTAKNPRLEVPEAGYFRAKMKNIAIATDQPTHLPPRSPKQQTAPINKQQLSTELQVAA